MTEIVPTGPVRLWLPGIGDTDRHIRAAAKAVEEYDSSLRLARHEVFGDWVVVIGEQGTPVLGFGKDVPSPDDVHSKLERHDTKRYGKRIMDGLARESERKRLDSQYRADEQNSELAEHYLSARRRLLGETGSMRGRKPFQGGVKRPTLEPHPSPPLPEPSNVPRILEERGIGGGRRHA